MSSDKKPSRLRFTIPSSITKLFSRTDRQRRQLLKELLSQITLDFQQNEKKFTNAKNLIETLIKSLESDVILNLKLALDKKEYIVSRCVTIKREFNQNKKISAYHLPVHVVCCKIWRWSDICRVGEIESSDYCANQYASARDCICINPYHYNKKKIEITKPSNVSSSGAESPSTYYQSTEKLSKSLANSNEFLDKAPTPKYSKKSLYMSSGVREYKKPSSSSRRVKHYESDGANIFFGSSERILSPQKKSSWKSEYSLDSRNRARRNFGSYDSILSPGSISSGSDAITGHSSGDIYGGKYRSGSTTNQATSEYSSGSMASSDDCLVINHLKNNDSSALLQSLNSIPDYVNLELNTNVQSTGYNNASSAASIPLLSAEENITGSGQYVSDYQNNLLSPASTITESSVENKNNYSPLTEKNLLFPGLQYTDFQRDDNGISKFYSSFERVPDPTTDFTSNLQGFNNQNSEVPVPSIITSSSSSSNGFANINSYNASSTFMGRMPPRNISQSNDELNSGFQDNNMLSALSSSLDLLGDASTGFFPDFQSNQLQSTEVSNSFGYDGNFNNYQNKNSQSVESLSTVGSNFASEFYYDDQVNLHHPTSTSSDVLAATGTEYQDDNILSTFTSALGLVPASSQEFEQEIGGNQHEESATTGEWYNDSENNNLPPSSNEISDTLTTQETALPQKIQQWAYVSYFEFSTRIGELFPCNYSKIVVDGSKNPSTFNRFSLGNIETFDEEDDEDEIREAIGKGVLLTYVNGNLYITCLSDSSIFIQSINYNYKYKIPSNSVLQLETGQTLQVFSNSEFTNVLGDKVGLGYHAVYELIKMCTIR